jgi:Flp pilus assembly pilin Flp
MMGPMINFLKAWLSAKLKAEEGQTIVEYVLLIVLIALAVFFATPSITTAVINVFSKTSSVLGVTTT